MLLVGKLLVTPNMRMVLELMRFYIQKETYIQDNPTYVWYLIRKGWRKDKLDMFPFSLIFVVDFIFLCHPLWFLSSPLVYYIGFFFALQPSLVHSFVMCRRVKAERCKLSSCIWTNAFEVQKGSVSLVYSNGSLLDFESDAFLVKAITRRTHTYHLY